MLEVRGPRWAWVTGVVTTVFGAVCLATARGVHSAAIGALLVTGAALVGFIPAGYNLLWAASSVRLTDRELVIHNHFRTVRVALDDVVAVAFEQERVPPLIRIINFKRVRGVGVVHTTSGARVEMIATASMGRGRDFVGTQFEPEARAKTDLIAASLDRPPIQA